MEHLLDNAEFGTLFKTIYGCKAVYLKHIKYNNTHRVLVDGVEKPYLYNSDGVRIGRGTTSDKYGMDLNLKCKI